MQSQYGTSQAIGIVQLRFTNGSGAFVIESQYGAVAVGRQGTGNYQFQLNTAVSGNNVTPVVTQFNQVPLVPGYLYGASGINTPLATSITIAANVIEIDFSASGVPTDPSSGTLLNIVFQTCFDGETGETFPAQPAP